MHREVTMREVEIWAESIRSLDPPDDPEKDEDEYDERNFYNEYQFEG